MRGFLWILLALVAGPAWSLTPGLKGGASAAFYNSSEIRFGYGWTAGAALYAGGDSWSAELDALLSKVAFPYTATAQDEEMLVRVPLLLNLNLDKNFSVGLGGFFSYGIGQVKTGDTQTEATYEEAQLSKSNYGAAFGLGLRAPLAGLTLTLDARFYWGLSNADSVSTTLRQNSAEILLGFLF